MPLVVEPPLWRGFTLISRVSRVYIEVDRKYLSQQYDVPFSVDAWVEGEIHGYTRI